MLSPGPGHPDDARRLRGRPRRLLASATVPVLGVCLGMQGLVTAYGGVVAPVEPAHGEVAAVTHDGTRALRRDPVAVRRGPLPLARGGRGAGRPAR